MTINLHPNKVQSISAWPPFNATSNDTTDLTNAIRNVIAPWRYRTDTAPPFSPTELVVMALAVCHESMKRKDLFFWIHDTFEYYQTQQTAAALWGSLCHYPASKHGPWEMRRDERYRRNLHYGPSFLNILRSYETPVDSTEGNLEYQVKLSVDLKDARNFLRPLLWPYQPEGHFPFLRLPAEIRTTIYEMVLRFPSAGLNLLERDLRKKRVVCTYSRDLKAPLCTGLTREPGPHRWSGWQGLRWKLTNMKRGMLEIGTFTQILALTRVNRQIREEAGGVFFAINTFCFDSAWHLRFTLEHLSARQRDSIERIAFDYRYDAAACMSMREAFVALATMKSLRWLHISIIEEEWKDLYWRDNASIEDRLQFNRAHRIPDSVQVVLDGDYPDNVERDIRADPIVDEVEAEDQRVESLVLHETTVQETRAQEAEVEETVEAKGPACERSGLAKRWLHAIRGKMCS